MSMVSWNCQGVGRSQDLVIPRLKEMRKEHFPELLFLMETKNSRDVLVDIQEWLGYDRIYTVNPEGISGGLALFWKSSVEVEFSYVDKHLLDFKVQLGSVAFCVSCVYGDPEKRLRPLVWERLLRIGVCRRNPWCMVGDFNDILHNGEKIGGPRRSENSFKCFAEMLRGCGMLELPSAGNSFTWGGRRYHSWIQCKLDRCFGNKGWFKSFPVSNQTFLDKRGSDHRPVLVRFFETKESYRGSFKFDKRFLNNPKVKETIYNVWNKNLPIHVGSVASRIRLCRRALSKWKKENAVNSGDKLIGLQKELEKEESTGFPRREVVFGLKIDLMKAYKEEEAYWSQKSRERWLKEGDRNSKFFHEAVKANRSRKSLDMLMDDEGRVQRAEASKGEVASNYFKALFKSDDPESCQEFLRDFKARVSQRMNEELIKTVSNQEVKEALFSIKPSSAPGADGMSGLFFQSYWDIVGNQVSREIKEFFVKGIFPAEWNYTLICLIPKIAIPLKMADYRPISLCSVLYKIISKILVTRLQPFLSTLVSSNQSAFVSERLISDNIIIAHEVIHGIRCHKSLSKEYMAVKSDMSKAYDRVEWGFLKELMRALGFHEKWIGWVMFCVSSVSYSVLINNQSFGYIEPGRGLRQGDPLSPFLFVLCTEGLTHLMNRAEREGLLQGIRFSTSGPSVHHLLFADDSLFICKASEDQCKVLSNILLSYGEVSGQVVNLNKSSITFGALVERDLRRKIKNLTGIENEGGAGTYLGLPECFSGSKAEMLAFISERMKVKFSGWFARFLSQGGKEILLKTVAMTMPIHAMSCFKLPKATCKKLTSAMADFWWDSVEHKRKIHWVKWEKLCLRKDQGGMKFKDIQGFNQALLAKQAWRILQSPDCLLARVLRSRYFENKDFLEVGLGSRPSFAWRSIIHGRDLLARGLKRCVGNGQTISVWLDNWILDGELRRPWIKNVLIDLNLMVRDLIDRPNRCWNREKVEKLFCERDVKLILASKPAVSHEDFWSWWRNKSGCYSVQSGYEVACQVINAKGIEEAVMKPSVNELKEQVWRVQTEPKLKVFMWKALNQAVPVAKLIVARGIKADQRCQRCGFEEESINHVLFSCSVARQMWALANFPSPQGGFHDSSVFVNFHYLLSLEKKRLWPIEVVRIFPWVIWFIWKHRNNAVFDRINLMTLEAVVKLKEEAELWFLSHALVVGGRERTQEVRSKVLERWRGPPKGWLKCNIGVSWSKKGAYLGGAWVVRNEVGRVLLHSRRAFSCINSLDEAMLTVLLWAGDSMVSHKLTKVILAINGNILVNAVNRPKAWPSFRRQVSEIQNCLKDLKWWKIEKEKKDANRGASLISQSVILTNRSQSYVAVGEPFWLREIFEEERTLCSIDADFGN